MSDPGSSLSQGRTITRRQGLLAVAVVGSAGLVAACTTSSEPDVPSPTPSPTGPIDESAAGERSLLTQYDQVIAALPALAAALSPLRAQHADHLAALTGEPAAATATSPASAVATAAASSTGPVTAKSAVRTLIAAERAAARQRIEACVAATEPGLARTLAFIAASEASHIPALKDVAT